MSISAINSSSLHLQGHAAAARQAESRSSPRHIDDLPPQIFQMIMSSVDKKSLAECAVVSKKWNVKTVDAARDLAFARFRQVLAGLIVALRNEDPVKHRAQIDQLVQLEALLVYLDPDATTPESDPRDPEFYTNLNVSSLRKLDVCKRKLVARVGYIMREQQDVLDRLFPLHAGERAEFDLKNAASIFAAMDTLHRQLVPEGMDIEQINPDDRDRYRAGEADGLARLRLIDLALKTEGKISVNNWERKSWVRLEVVAALARNGDIERAIGIAHTIPGNIIYRPNGNDILREEEVALNSVAFKIISNTLVGGGQRFNAVKLAFQYRQEVLRFMAGVGAAFGFPFGVLGGALNTLVFRFCELRAAGQSQQKSIDAYFTELFVLIFAGIVLGSLVSVAHTIHKRVS